jgi:hypothetical protein
VTREPGAAGRVPGRQASLRRAPTGAPVVPYRRSMPARKRPTREDTVAARKILLDGLAGDAGIFDLISELAPLHPRDNTFAS